MSYNISGICPISTIQEFFLQRFGYQNLSFKVLAIGICPIKIWLSKFVYQNLSYKDLAIGICPTKIWLSEFVLQRFGYRNLSYKDLAIKFIYQNLSYKDLAIGICPTGNSGISLPGPTPNLNITSNKTDYVIIG